MNYLFALAVLAAVLLMALVRIGISAHRRGRDVKRALAEGEQRRANIAALQAEVEELKQAAAGREQVARQFVPAPVVTADQRAGSLEMLRSGADPAAVSAAMGLSQAEVALLQKVEKLQEPKGAAKERGR